MPAPEVGVDSRQRPGQSEHLAVTSAGAVTTEKHDLVSVIGKSRAGRRRLSGPSGIRALPGGRRSGAGSLGPAGRKWRARACALRAGWGRSPSRNPSEPPSCPRGRPGGMEPARGGGDGGSSADPRSAFVLSNLAEVVERVLTFLPAKALLRVAG